MTVDPRPPEPAWTRTFWPGVTWARSTRACQAARDTSGIAAASRRVSEAGLSATSSCRSRARARRGRGARTHVLREGADPQVVGAGVDLVAYLEGAYGRADPGHHAGGVVAEYERGPVLQEPLELAVADHLVQRVD